MGAIYSKLGMYVIFRLWWHVDNPRGLYLLRCKLGKSYFKLLIVILTVNSMFFLYCIMYLIYSENMKYIYRVNILILHIDFWIFLVFATSIRIKIVFKLLNLWIFIAMVIWGQIGLIMIFLQIWLIDEFITFYNEYSVQNVDSFDN